MPPSKPKNGITPPPVRVARAHGKGRGVFATRKIRKGEIFERAPVVPLTFGEWRHVSKTVLGDYAFDWGPGTRSASIVLGYGSLYNHSNTPNARFDYRLREKVYVFIALRDIAKDEEICTNYNGVPDDATPLWFQKG